jgi:hypothetical protein
MNKIKARMNKIANKKIATKNATSMKKLASDDSIFDVWVRRLDNDREMELELPVNNLESELKKGLGEDCLNYDIIVVDYESAIEHGVDNYGINALNDLAKQIDELSESEFEVVVALVNESLYSIEDAIRVANSGDYAIYYDCESYADFAREYINEMGGVKELPESVLDNYFDYQEFGEDEATGLELVQTKDSFIIIY